MLLTEDRISKVKEKYYFPPKTWDDIIDASYSIAPNHKYLDWISKIIKIESIPINVVADKVKEFDKVRSSLDKKDLYQYKSFDDLINSIENRNVRRRSFDDHKDSETVYEDDDFKVIVPKSHASSCYYGAGTKWCTASRNNENHFKNYNQKGKLFYILSKTLPTSNRFYKVALLKNYSGDETFFDAPDKQLSLADMDEIDFITSHPLMKSINTYFNFEYADEIKKISEEEKERVLRQIAREQEWAERRANRLRRMTAAAQARKDNDEWNPQNTDSIGIKANALMEYLIEEGEFPNADEEITEIEDRIVDLQNEMESNPEVINDPDGDVAQDYGEQLNELEEELANLIENQPTVYDIWYEDNSHYGLPVFEYEGEEYAIGDDEEADDAIKEYHESLIDDVGLDGFDNNFLSYYVDGEQVADYLESWVRSDIEENPEFYLDEDDRELIDSAKKEIENLEEILGDLNDNLEETDDDGEYDVIWDEITELESQIENIKDDEDNYEWPEDEIEKMVEYRLDEIKYNPMGWIEDYDLDLRNFIDVAELVDGIIENDGRGNGLASYDGYENEVTYDGEWFYIYRI